MSDNWVVQNLQNALETWNEKLAEIWQLITTTPQNFKGGGIWAVIVNINGAVQAIGLALLVLFFCGRYGTHLRQLQRCQETGARFKALYPICARKGGNHLWYGVNACPV